MLLVWFLYCVRTLAHEFCKAAHLLMTHWAHLLYVPIAAGNGFVRGGTSGAFDGHGSL